MKLPREYKKYIGNYSGCKNAYGKKMLRKFGYGPETEGISEVVETVAAPKKKTTRKKKSTK